MFNKDVFIERLNLLINKHNISKQSLANAVGVNRVSISQFSRGVHLPSIETLVAIAKYFDVSVDYLLGITDDNKGNP